MTSVEKWNALSADADLAVAMVVLVLGVGLLSARGKLAASRAARVANGELSPEQAKKNAQLVGWGSFGITGGGVFLLVMWAFGF
jgi:hypothetical protein